VVDGFLGRGERAVGETGMAGGIAAAALGFLSENEEVVCHKSAWCSRNGTAVLMGVRLYAFDRNSISSVYFAHSVTKFGDTN
jgi:hypothetical protein